MKISIIMPTYNDKDSIIETFDSVINQTYKNWELTIVDDGSTDNTEEVIKSYIKKYKLEDKIKYFYQENKDQLNAIINGIKYINGDYVYILHSDDLMPSNDFLEKLTKVAGEFKNVDAFIGDLIVIDGDSKQTGIQKVDYYSKKESVLPTLMLWLGRNLYADFMLAKKEVFESSIKDSYLTWNMPFWTRMDSDDKMINIKNLEFPILKYRVHENNYINNDIGKLNVINGELRTVTRLMKFYNIPMYKSQFYLYRVFNKLGIKKLFKPLFFNKEEKNKGEIVEFVIMKRFGEAYKQNLFLDSIVKFYKNNTKREIQLPTISESDMIYKGKDMRLFNKNLLNGNLSELYIHMLDEMSNGFDVIVANNEKELKIAEDLAKFLCIYSHVTINKRY
ncbi:glycosyltransferase family 2 protein [Paraclostridium ghonii]|uniref:glycosyltransferase family 2 protein n=1 Tax=Paraclostridium ghonii TaxID=29358 RepID=UPI00202CEA55|nr:glycosyltransferase family 2 protein [Paeniclostridium ghonii]MCM0166774.1 glycosyltransferase [Paeniclostridium ghonii]